MKDIQTIALIVRGLCALKKETPYVEFKVNDADPDMIGERISAISNMALLSDEPYGYIVWGIEDETHSIVGTKLSFFSWKKGEEDIVAYWRNLLSPSLDLEAYEVTLDDKRVLVLEIPAAAHFASAYKKQIYCRIGSYTKNIKDYPSLEKELWQRLDLSSPESRIALSGVKKEEIPSFLSFPSYWKAVGVSNPLNEDETITRFCREGFLLDEKGGHYSITVLGALLFASDLSSFPKLEGKALRIVNYAGESRLETKGKQTFLSGYAISFEECFKAITALTQTSDIYVNGVRKDHYIVPPIAVREALGNLLIHQDLLSNGGPLVEIFVDRVEFSNPGFLSVPIDRLIDSPPKSVNERLASFLRRIDIGDTAGSGFDKIVASLEKEKLPPFKMEEAPSGVRLMLFKEKPFEEYSQEEKLAATYDHVVISYLSSKRATNKSLRDRFGLGEEAKFRISRLLALALDSGKIKKAALSDKKDTAYLPYWA